ncbi:cytochrome c oxidase assembly protein [Kineococcus sp. SYSU DK003]|uniref:cytochrome c oxidase assembly protein n=1 Tax=Kineococcus sp. SYSU DK003 TaxID=3383124 RepID=UPI003D7EAD21
MIPGWLLLSAAGALLAGYLGAEQRLHRRGDRWPVSRSAAAVGAVVAVAAAGLLPVRSALEETAVHLLVTMAAPLLLALSAPVSLVLRTVTGPARAGVVAVLHSRWARTVTWLPLATALEAGGLCLYYLAPLPHGWHGPLTVHMVLAGYLFSAVLVGPDPVPRRPGILPCSLALLFVFAVHGVVAKLLYAAGEGTAAQLLYYGGDVVEIATAVALFARWYRRSAPRPARGPVALQQLNPADGRPR